MWQRMSLLADISQKNEEFPQNALRLLILVVASFWRLLSCFSVFFGSFRYEA